MVFCSILLAACSFFYVYVSKALVDIATGQGDGSLLVFALLLLGVILLRILTRSLRTYWQNRSLFRMKNEMRQRQFDSLLRLSFLSKEKFHTGDMVARVQGDVDTVSSAFCQTLPGLIGAFLQFMVAFVYMLYLDARLAWVLVILIPVGLLAARYVLYKMRDMSRDVRDKESRVQAHIQESLQHQSLIQAMEYDGQSSRELSSLLGGWYDKSLNRTRFGIVAHIISALCFSGSYALAFLWGVNGLASGAVTYGLMTAFLQLVNQLQRPLMELGEMLPSLFHSTASIDRLLELDAVDKEELMEPCFLEGSVGIRLDSLSFAYEQGDEAVFENFTYDFTPGSKTALVGETGVGKTTLIKLILAFLKPRAGKVLFYSELSGACEASVATRCNLVYVPQGNSLLSGTIRQNLLMGKVDASDEELREALHTAVADFVFDLPQGLDTPCFESGGGLSEGQAQRIAIARALLRPGNILLLDEFSSALDGQTEALLMERLLAQRPAETMIFITHREIVSQYCDHTLKL
ncbi:MAG: ABC transporter ATP-binding protein [Bacteroidales bacterium]|nr:ABC transporter ATP-binding protein [Bacteroidales bacterium]